MSYIRSSLGSNETLHYIAHFHWLKYAMAYGVLIISIILGFYGYSLSYSAWVFGAPPLIGLPIFFSVMLPIWTSEIGVTNQRVIYKTGLLSRDTSELQLRSIEEVSIQQTILGRIFGYGRIDIHGTGNEQIMLPNLSHPLELRKALQEAIGRAQPAAEPASGGAAPQQARVI